MRPFIVSVALLGLVSAVPAQDRDQGEGDRIERREEWFFSTRRAGTTSPAEMGRKRAEAAAATLRALETRSVGRFQAAVAGWVSMGPSPANYGSWAFSPVSGRVSALTRGGDGTVYAGTASGGLWRTRDGGTSWTSLFDRAGTLTVGAVAVDPGNPSVLWVGTGENRTSCQEYFGMGVLRSVDGGATWERRGLDDLATVADLVVDPRDAAHVVVGGRLRGCSTGTSSAGGIFTTDDAGGTWTQRLAGEFVHGLAQSPTARNVWWATSDRGVFRSEDNAVSWTLQTTSGLPGGSTGRTELAIAPSDDRVVYALFQAGSGGTPELWRTGDRGLTWARKSTGTAACDGQCFYNMVLRVKVDDPAVVYRGTLHLFKTTNSGASWTDLSGAWGPSQRVHTDVHALLLDPAAPLDVWVGSDGGVWHTVDGGATFTNANGNLSLTQLYAVRVDPNDPARLCAGAQDNASLARAGSDVWSLQLATGDGTTCGFHPTRTGTVYAATYPGTYPGIYRSTGGLFGSYSLITGAGSGIDPSDRISWVTPLVLDPVTPDVVYLATHKLYRSTNTGTTWTRVGPADFTGGTGAVLTLDVHPTVHDVVAVGTLDGRVWRSITAGSTFTQLTPGLPARAISDLALDPADPARLLVVLGGFGTAHLWEWTAAGGWIAGGGGLPDVPANTVVMRSAAEVVVGTDVGIFRSVDGGRTFTPFMDGLPVGVVVNDLQLHPSGVLTAGTYGRGAWQITLPALPAAAPGRVDGLLLARLPGGDLQASWPEACNAAQLPQSYSLQEGSLAALRGGTYDHAPVGARCDLVSPAVFTPAPAAAYYLLVPNEGGREGSPGTDSAGTSRPQISILCGPREEAACP